MIWMLDVDGDGEVNFKEFYKMATGQSLAPIGVALPPPIGADKAKLKPKIGAGLSEDESSSDSEVENEIWRKKGAKAAEKIK